MYSSTFKKFLQEGSPLCLRWSTCLSTQLRLWHCERDRMGIAVVLCCTEWIIPSNWQKNSPSEVHFERSSKSICNYKSMISDKCESYILLKLSKEVGSATSPGDLFQCLASWVITKCFLIYNLNFLCSCLTHFLSHSQWLRKTTYSFSLLCICITCVALLSLFCRLYGNILPSSLAASASYTSGCSQCSLLDLFCLVSFFEAEMCYPKLDMLLQVSKSHCILNKHPQARLPSLMWPFSFLLYVESKSHCSNKQNCSRSISQKQIQGKCLQKCTYHTSSLTENFVGGGRLYFSQLTYDHEEADTGKL